MRSIQSSKPRQDHRYSAIDQPLAAVLRYTQSYHEEFECQKSTSCLVTTDFCRPYRNDAVNSTNANTGDDSSAAHPGDIVGGGL